jgi:phosphate transport system substrate-binding protein
VIPGPSFRSIRRGPARAACIAGAFLLLCGLLLVTAGYRSQKAGAAAPGGSLAAHPTSTPSGTLTGVGASSIQPFYSTLFYRYAQLNQRLKVNYSPSGSGPGVSAIQQNTANFGQSEIPMTATQLAAAKGPVIQVPVDLGGVAISYHLSGVTKALHLSGPLLAKIYLRQITKWNDPAIAALNHGVHLPAENIVPVYRSDTSGPGYDLDQYLITTAGATWQGATGSSTPSTTWPTAARGSGTSGQQLNSGVASYIAQTEGAIGYVEYAYAFAAHFSNAALANKAGAFVAPSIASIRSAGASITDLSPANFNIVDGPGRKTYPLANYSWALIYQKQADTDIGIQLGKLLQWITTSGQRYSLSLGYATLPANAAALAHRSLLGLESSSGQPIFSS